MKKHICCLLAALIATTGYADGPFIAGQVLTASELNAALAVKTNNASAAITGGTISGLSSPLPVTSGGTGVTSVSSANVTAVGASSPRPLAAHFADQIHARDYGIKCDGSSDDTAAINALGAALTSQQAVIFPQGVCLFSATLNFNLNDSGIYGNSTTFLYTGISTTNDLVLLTGAGATSQQNSVFKGIKILSNTVMSGGAALHLQKASYMRIQDVSTGEFLPSNNENIWNGLWIDRPNFVIVDGLISHAKNDALAVSALGVTTNYQYDVWINNSKLGQSSVGFHVGGGVDNVHIDNTEITTNTINVLVDNAISAFKNQEVYIGRNTVTDQGGDFNYYIDDPLCDLTNYGIVSISGPITHANNFDGIFVNSFPNCQLVVDSPIITNNGRNGIRINDSSTVLSISPNTIITANVNYGIDAGFAYSGMKSQGQVYGNTAGQFGPNVTQAPISASTITSTVSTGTAPFVVASTTPVSNLSIGGTSANSSQLLGSTWMAPGTIGSTSPNTGSFTSINGTLGVWIGYTPGDTTFGTQKANNGNAGTAIAFRGIETVGSAVTSGYDSFQSIPSTSAASFTLGALRGFHASDILTLGAGSAVTSQFGFAAEDLTKGVNNYGFYSAVTSGANKWGFYESGNANNAFAGKSSFGGTTAPVATVDVTGNIAATTSILSSGPTSGVGYTSGSGGTITQATSKTAGVTLNTVTGQITMNNAALAAAATACFTLTNSAIAAVDVVNTNIASGATSGAYTLQVEAVAAGSARICVNNRSAGSLSEAIVINYAVIKGSAN